MRFNSVLFALFISGFISCTTEDTLSNEALLTRISLDLRGFRPTLEELREAKSHRWNYQETVDKFIQHPNFARVTAERWAPILDTRQDETLFPAEQFGLDNEFHFAYAVGDEPIRVIEEVIRRNLPWTTLLTADWTVLNQDLQKVYPANWVGDAPNDEDDWAVARYTDGRPSAGLLMGNGLWWRYETSLNNASRQRANQITRIFLCQNYLDIPVTFDSTVDLTSESALQTAIKENAGCVACHATLDPLAAFLGGVFARRKSEATEMIYYHPEREGLASQQLGVTPMWNGIRGQHLGDLGKILISDPRFGTCATEQIFSSLTGSIVEREVIQRYASDWTENWNQSMSRLVREILLSDSYQERWTNGDVPWKTVSLLQLERQVEVLTGFRLVDTGYPLLRADSQGFASMVGEGGFSIPLLLIQQELAHLSARYWMMESDRVPFETADIAKPAERIEQLSLMILGLSPTNAELEDWNQYISVVQTELSPVEIWASIASVMMQDPRFLVY